MIARYPYECGDIRVYKVERDGSLTLKEVVPNPLKRRKDDQKSQK